MVTNTQQARPPRTRLGTVVQAGFFLSGMTGLVYQVIWLRVLATAFGSTTLATSVVLTAFMGGLALGSLVGGRRADAAPRPFRLYAWLELGVGAYCFASLWLLAGVRGLYLAAARVLPFESPALAALQFVLAVAVLVVPTALMGATLPVVSRGFVRRVDQVGAAVASLYGINTFGAVVGAGLAGFLILPLVGLRAATWAAVLVNVAIGVVVLLAERTGGGRPAAAEPGPAGAETVETPLPRLLTVVLLVGFGLSGMAALMLEVAWTRALIMLMGSSIYAFTTILVSVLLGIALGSLAVGRLWGRRPMSPLWFGGVEALLALTCLGAAWAIGRTPTAFIGIFQAYSESYGALVAVQLVTVLLVLAAPTLLMGATLPILSRVYITRSGQVGTLLGRAYAANTAGAIVGSFSAGFLVIPLIGVRPTMLAASAVYAAVGVAVLVAGSGGRRWPRVAAVATAVATAALVVLLPSWKRSVMSAGVFLGYQEVAPEQGRIAFYEEGPTATVAVFEWASPAVTTLVVNGKTDASTGDDMGTQLSLGHLPMLLAENRERVLVIGLGSGITAGAAARHDPERIDALEIEPAVVRAAGYFSQANRGVLDDPRCRVVVGDARSYVASTQVKYDVISSEPSNPWIAGIGSLFTVEHFRDCRRVLAPGGVMCQWIHGTQIGTRDLATVVRSFIAVFPEATLWTTGTPGDLLLMGGQEARVPVARLGRRIQESAIFGSPPESDWMPSADVVLARLVMGPDDLARFAQLGPPNTDDLPVLEFSAPRSLYAPQSYKHNAEALAAVLTQPPTEWMEADASRPLDADFVARLVHARLGADFAPLDEGSRIELQRVLARDPDYAEGHYLLGLVLQRRGDQRGARRALERAVGLAPEEGRYREALAGR